MTDRQTVILIGLGLSAGLILFALYARKWFLQGYRRDRVAQSHVVISKIKGLEKTTLSEVNFEVQRGGKFVAFQYCVSVLLASYKRSSSIYFLKAGESALIKGLPFTIISIVAGPWGIPWGPIWTVQSLIMNLAGGRDLTAEVLASFASAENATATKVLHVG